MSISRVQEDWQFVVATPDPIEEAPELGTSMYPAGEGVSPQLFFSLNYRDAPDYQAGGLEVSVWVGDTLEVYSDQATALLSTDNEKVSWTQQANISSGNVDYQIILGKSTTWGDFGDGTNLKVSYPISISDFSSYSSDTSLLYSGVSWAANLMTSMTLVQVRYYQDLMLVSTDTSVRSKHQSPWF